MIKHSIIEVHYRIEQFKLMIKNPANVGFFIRKVRAGSLCI